MSRRSIPLFGENLFTSYEDSTARKLRPVDVQWLTQYIVRQTTVLLAQISTAAGVRAPLAHVADQVFFELARELENQGVRRNVVADMFGLALRSYQLKMQRLADTAGAQRSLWQDVHLALEGTSLSKRELLGRFTTVDARAIGAVLGDLVDSGLAYKSGRGSDAVFGLTSASDRQRLAEAGGAASLANLIWLSLATRGGQTLEELRGDLGCDESILQRAVARLISDGRIEVRGGALFAQHFEIPVGASEGWEAAVCDHFRAVSTAIAKKLATRSSDASDTTGGTTLSFTVHDGHPQRDQVYGLLERVRADVGQLWREVSDFNRTNVPPAGSDRVTFYFGQCVTPRAIGAENEPDAPAPDVRERTGEVVELAGVSPFSEQS